MSSPRLFRSASSSLASVCYKFSFVRVTSTRIVSSAFHSSRHLRTENTDRLKGPVSSDSTMQAVKNTIAENLGKIIPGHELAPEDSKFSLEEVPDLSGKVALVTGGSEGIVGLIHCRHKHVINQSFRATVAPTPCSPRMSPNFSSCP